jgi:hypothetical protein
MSFADLFALGAKASETAKQKHADLQRRFDGLSQAPSAHTLAACQLAAQLLHGQHIHAKCASQALAECQRALDLVTPQEVLQLWPASAAASTARRAIIGLYHHWRVQLTHAPYRQMRRAELAYSVARQGELMTSKRSEGVSLEEGLAILHACLDDETELQRECMWLIASVERCVRGCWSSALAHYTAFLQLAEPDDPRREIAEFFRTNVRSFGRDLQPAARFVTPLLHVDQIEALVEGTPPTLSSS